MPLMSVQFLGWREFKATRRANETIELISSKFHTLLRDLLWGLVTIAKKQISRSKLSRWPYFSA